MNTIINIKTDKALKQQAQSLADEMGIPLTTVINSYLKQFVREQKIVLDINPPVNKNIIKEWENISLENKTTGKFNKKENLFKHLGM